MEGRHRVQVPFAGRAAAFEPLAFGFLIQRPICDSWPRIPPCSPRVLIDVRTRLARFVHFPNTGDTGSSKCETVFRDADALALYVGALLHLAVDPAGNDLLRPRRDGPRRAEVRLEDPDHAKAQRTAMDFLS